MPLNWHYCADGNEDETEMKSLFYLGFCSIQSANNASESLTSENVFINLEVA